MFYFHILLSLLKGESSWRRKFAVSSSKGGVGKTFCCANLGAALADIGQKVLLIDTDRQQSLSKYYHIEEKALNGLREMVLNGSAENCISSTVYPNLDIVINNDYDEDVKSWVSKSPVSRMLYLSAALKELDALYDIIIIDTVGTVEMGGYQEMAIRAVDQCITPVSADWIAAKELPTTIALLKLLEPAPGIGSMNPIPPLTVLFWGVKRTTDNRQVVQMVTDQNGELFLEYFRQANGKLHVLNTTIPHTETYNKSFGVKTPVHLYEPTREGPTPSGAESMLSLIHELFPHLKSFNFKNTKEIKK